MKSKEDKGSYKISKNLYYDRENEFGSKTERSYSNISQQNKTYNSRYQDKQENILSEEKRMMISDERSKTQHNIPNGILKLRKQMLNQEYQLLEDQKKELQALNLSPDTQEQYMKSLDKNEEEQYYDNREPDQYELAEEYESP